MSILRSVTGKAQKSSPMFMACFREKGKRWGWVEWVSWFSCFCFSNAKVLHFDLEYCTGYFSCCFNKTPDLGNLRKDWFGLQFEVWKSWQQEPAVTGHIASAVRKCREMDADAQVVLSLFFHLRP